MTKINENKKTFWRNHNAMLRDPLEIIGKSFENTGFDKKLLCYKTDDGFLKILKTLGITLFITREYEHLIIALSMQDGKLQQSFLPIPHPTGMAVDREKSSLFVAATRNPNQIIEFKPIKEGIDRIDCKKYSDNYLSLVPTRIKFFPGMYYIHDISFIDKCLYATSVGQNGIIKVDFTRSDPDQLIWWPKCTEDKSGKPNQCANFLQLNSIASGETLQSSFFAASSDVISSRRPGYLNYKVDGKGVIFDGNTREVYVRGLTRPHSARLYDGKLWVNNSGYGEIGYVENRKFEVLTKLDGWTRGLCKVKNVLFVGTSLIIPKFYKYAPGLSLKKQACGVHAIDINTGKLIGSIVWPYANQIFAIEWLDKKITQGFMFKQMKRSSVKIKNALYNYMI